MNHVIIASINVNSIRYKFEQIKLIVEKNVDILIIQETKIDDSFPDGQFLLDEFLPPFRKDRNKNGGGIMIFIRENIPAKLLKDNQLPNDIEGLFVELNFRSKKWLLFGTYHPPSQCSKYYFSQVELVLDKYLNKYDKYILIGDFNMEVQEPAMDQFMVNFGLNNLVKEYTCYKSMINPRCIDLI